MHVMVYLDVMGAWRLVGLSTCAVVSVRVIEAVVELMVMMKGMKGGGDRRSCFSGHNCITSNGINIQRAVAFGGGVKIVVAQISSLTMLILGVCIGDGGSCTGLK